MVQCPLVPRRGGGFRPGKSDRPLVGRICERPTIRPDGGGLPLRLDDQRDGDHRRLRRLDHRRPLCERPVAAVCAMRRDRLSGGPIDAALFLPLVPDDPQFSRFGVQPRIDVAVGPAAGRRVSFAWRSHANHLLRRRRWRNVRIDRHSDDCDVQAFSGRGRRRAARVRQAGMVHAGAQHVPVGERRGDGPICGSHPPRLPRRARRGGDLFHRGAHRQYLCNDFVGLEHLYRHAGQHAAFRRRDGRAATSAALRHDCRFRIGHAAVHPADHRRRADSIDIRPGL